MMTKRSKKPVNQLHQKAKDVFEEFGNFSLMKGDIGRLIQFGEPASSDYGDIGAGEFVVDPWIDLWLDAIDVCEYGDKSKLVALMKSGCPLPNVIVPHIGDLIDRWDLVRPKHRMRTPSYKLTNDDIAMSGACCDVDDLLSAGKSLPDALAVVAVGRGIKISVLREFHGKRRSPDRRAQARSYKHKRRTGAGK
jgi:hypothetical protein